MKSVEKVQLLNDSWNKAFTLCSKLLKRTHVKKKIYIWLSYSMLKRKEKGMVGSWHSSKKQRQRLHMIKKEPYEYLYTI